MSDLDTFPKIIYTCPMLLWSRRVFCQYPAYSGIPEAPRRGPEAQTQEVRDVKWLLCKSHNTRHAEMTNKNTSVPATMSRHRHRGSQISLDGYSFLHRHPHRTPCAAVDKCRTPRAIDERHHHVWSTRPERHVRLTVFKVGHGFETAELRKCSRLLLTFG